MEENVDDEAQGSYMEDLVEARIETAIVEYEYAPLTMDVEATEETSSP